MPGSGSGDFLWGLYEEPLEWQWGEGATFCGSPRRCIRRWETWLCAGVCTCMQTHVSQCEYSRPATPCGDFGRGTPSPDKLLSGKTAHVPPTKHRMPRKTAPSSQAAPVRQKVHAPAAPRGSARPGNRPRLRPSRRGPGNRHRGDACSAAAGLRSRRKAYCLETREGEGEGERERERERERGRERERERA